MSSWPIDYTHKKSADIAALLEVVLIIARLRSF